MRTTPPGRNIRSDSPGARVLVPSLTGYSLWMLITPSASNSTFLPGRTWPTLPFPMRTGMVLRHDAGLVQPVALVDRQPGVVGEEPQHRGARRRRAGPQVADPVAEQVLSGRAHRIGTGLSAGAPGLSLDVRHRGLVESRDAHHHRRPDPPQRRQRRLVRADRDVVAVEQRGVDPEPLLEQRQRQEDEQVVIVPVLEQLLHRTHRAVDAPGGGGQALRLAGAARGELDRRRLVRREPRRRYDRLGGIRLGSQRRDLVDGPDHALCVALERPVGEQQRQTVLGRQGFELELAGLEPRGDRLQPQRGQIQQHPLQTVRCQDAEPIARTEAERGQAGGQPRRRLVELGEVHGLRGSEADKGNLMAARDSAAGRMVDDRVDHDALPAAAAST